MRRWIMVLGALSLLFLAPQVPDWARCYVYLKRTPNGFDPVALGHDYYRGLVAKGYRLGCSWQYDEFILECLA